VSYSALWYMLKWFRNVFLSDTGNISGAPLPLRSIYGSVTRYSITTPLIKTQLIWYMT